MIGLGSLAKLEVLPDGSVMESGPEGLAHFDTNGHGGFEAPEGDTNLTLEYEPAKPAYVLRDPAQGTTTEFTQPKGAIEWLPTVSEGPVATNQITDEYKTVEPEPGKIVVQPTLELASHPTATCGRGALEHLEIAAKGCRALEFVYAKETTATGEGREQWGAYKNRLKSIEAVAYNPVSKAMARTAAAAYLYDSKGRLRAEADPRTELRTSYAYDSENHVTAMEPPGQEPWALTYGTIAGDPRTGRLLKVTRAGETRKLAVLEAPTQKEAPKLSGSPLVGVKMGVSSGTWSNGPIVYGYQWQDCNAGGKECASILGATNPNYTPVTGDTGHTLVAVVTATNGVGSTAVATAPSSVVGGEYARQEGEQYSPQPGATVEYNVPLEGPEAPEQMGTNKETGRPEPEKWGQKDDPAQVSRIIGIPQSCS
jgi:hypothetical protein